MRCARHRRSVIIKERMIEKFSERNAIGGEALEQAANER